MYLPTRQLLLSVMLALPAVAALADEIDTDAPTAEPAMVTQNKDAGRSATATAPGTVTNAVPSTVPSVASAAPATIAGFGKVVDADDLSQQRGGSDLGNAVPVGGILAHGTVSDNRAIDVVTGANTIRDGAFTNASGIPVVIQNTGANVLIQSATVVNVQLR